MHVCFALAMVLFLIRIFCSAEDEGATWSYTTSTLTFILNCINSRHPVYAVESTVR